MSDQEEADTKVVLHAMRFLSENKEESVCIRSPSGDTDILVIALGTIIERLLIIELCSTVVTAQIGSRFG